MALSVSIMGVFPPSRLSPAFIVEERFPNCLPPHLHPIFCALCGVFALEPVLWTGEVLTYLLIGVGVVLVAFEMGFEQV